MSPQAWQTWQTVTHWVIFGGSILVALAWLFNHYAGKEIEKYNRQAMLDHVSGEHEATRGQSAKETEQVLEEFASLKDEWEKQHKDINQDFENQLEKASPGTAAKARDYYYKGIKALNDKFPRYKDAADYFLQSIKEYPTRAAYFRLSLCLNSMKNFRGAFAAMAKASQLNYERDQAAYLEFFKDRQEQIYISYLEQDVARIEAERGEFVLFGIFELAHALGRWEIAYSAEWYNENDSKRSYMLMNLGKSTITSEANKMFMHVFQYKDFDSLDPNGEFVQDIITHLKQIGRLGQRTFWTVPEGPYRRIYIISAHEPKKTKTLSVTSKNLFLLAQLFSFTNLEIHPALLFAQVKRQSQKWLVFSAPEPVS